MQTFLCPYLNFDGNTAKAMQFYQSVFGGQLNMQSFGEAHPDTAAHLADRIMHAHLEADDLTLMASDTHPEFSPPYVVGNHIHLSIVGSDAERLTGYFNKLAEGGKVVKPLERQFWGAVYGQVIDPFGVSWMVNIEDAQEQ